jgi:peptidoglycan hydrolase-like protein with peptidoglycan-binding domain
MRKLILGTASVLALGIGGAGLDYTADAENAPPKTESMPLASETSHAFGAAANLSKDDIRQAQLELRNMGLYNGSLDGVVGPATKRALGLFQKNNGLQRTATLDPQTLDALIGNPSIGQGSSMPPNTVGARSMMNSSGGSDLGTRSMPK